MKYRISKSFEFSASHMLQGLPSNHQCARLHGHNYVATFTLESDCLNWVGFVRDYGELKIIKEFIDESMDHRHLNDLWVFNPTAENIATWLFNKFLAEIPELREVTISETPKTTATYRPHVILKNKDGICYVPNER